jgi:phage replication-related protein YjqB (UPF0714/DUF867 family)
MVLPSEAFDEKRALAEALNAASIIVSVTEGQAAQAGN